MTMTECPERVVLFRSEGADLVGILHAGHSEARFGIVVLVGGPQYRVGSHRMFVEIARALCAEGWPVLRFDFRGMGDSGGEFPGFDRLDTDIAAAVDALQEACPEVESVVLLGLCDGASAAALYAGTDARVTAAVMLNPWVHTAAAAAKAYVWHYYPRRLMQRDFWTGLVRGDVRLRASITDFVGKLRKAATQPSAAAEPGFVERMRRGLEAYTGRLLVVASERDLTAAEFVDLWSSDARWAKIRQRAAFVRLAEADHTLSKADAMQAFLNEVRGWLPPAVTSDDRERKRAWP